MSESDNVLCVHCKRPLGAFDPVNNVEPWAHLSCAENVAFHSMATVLCADLIALDPPVSMSVPDAISWLHGAVKHNDVVQSAIGRELTEGVQAMVESFVEARRRADIGKLADAAREALREAGRALNEPDDHDE